MPPRVAAVTTMPRTCALCSLARGSRSAMEHSQFKTVGPRPDIVQTTLYLPRGPAQRPLRRDQCFGVARLPILSRRLGGLTAPDKMADGTCNIYIPAYTRMPQWLLTQRPATHLDVRLICPYSAHASRPPTARRNRSGAECPSPLPCCRLRFCAVLTDVPAARCAFPHAAVTSAEPRRPPCCTTARRLLSTRRAPAISMKVRPPSRPATSVLSAACGIARFIRLLIPVRDAPTRGPS